MLGNSLMLTVSDRRRALRAFKQRGIVVQVGALDQLYIAYKNADAGTFVEFLDKAFDHLSCADGTADGILTKRLAESIGSRLMRDTSRFVGDVTASIEVIDIFTVPQWRANPASSYGTSTSAVLRTPEKTLVDAPANAKSAVFRSRYELMLSKTLRNERFKPPLSGISAVSSKKSYFELTGVESLRAGQGEKLVLGMLTQLEEDTWSLEDINGVVRLDLSQVTITAGLHTDGSFVIAQGMLIEEDGTSPIFVVTAMGTPPLETREQTINALGNSANLFGGQYDYSQTENLLELESSSDESVFLFISDVALDSPRVLSGLHHLFQGYITDHVIPTVIFLMGSFLSHPFGQEWNDVQTLQEGFAQLGEMIKSKFPLLAESSIFVIVPGTNDAGPGNILPRPPLPTIVTRGFIDAIGSKNIYFTTNPCRMRYMTQEIVILRDNIMQKMMRHCAVKPDFSESGLTCEHLLKTVVDQAYLCPLPLTARPVLWAHHHSLWLFPTPHVIITADKVDGFICKYGGSLGLNPGSFATDFSFQVYLPAERRAQQCSLDSEKINLEARIESRTGDVLSTSQEEPRLGDNNGNERNPLQNRQYPSSTLGIQREDEGETSPNEREESLQEVDVKGKEGDNYENQAADDLRTSINKSSSSEQSDGDSEDREESDDESLLVPAEGVKKIDIKALVRNAIAEDTSQIGQTGEDEDSD